jgi:hypothetical protein
MKHPENALSAPGTAVTGTSIGATGGKRSCALNAGTSMSLVLNTRKIPDVRELAVVSCDLALE